jgi:hypothetical protein
MPFPVTENCWSLLVKFCTSVMPLDATTGDLVVKAT